MGGKWGQYTPEEQAFFKSVRTFAYVSDPDAAKRKSQKNVQRHATKMLEDAEYRANYIRRRAIYYQKHKDKLKLKRDAKKLLKEQDEEKLQKIKIEKILNKQLREEDKVKRRELRQKIKEAKILKEAKESMTKKSKRSDSPRVKKPVVVKEQPAAFLFPEVSHIVSFE
jgi:hypothetical protein